MITIKCILHKLLKVVKSLEILDQSDSDKGPRLMPSSEKGISVLAKI